MDQADRRAAQGAPHGDHGASGGHSYGMLALELAIDFVIMYLVMYAMIATLAHFRFNLNTLYMTLMMVAPMAIVMLAAMWTKFPSRSVNIAIVATAATIFVASFAAIRFQAGAGDRELLRAMIPHHSGAILMCGQAKLVDAEVKSLCEQIIRSQTEEIARMEAIRARMQSEEELGPRVVGN